jgi:hypothetical protein
MPRTIFIPDVGVVTAALICISDQHRDTGPRCPAIENAGKYLGLVLFLTLGRQQTLTRSPPPQVWSQIILRQLQSGRDAVNNHNIPRAMTLAGSGDAKQLSKRIPGHHSDS